ncbi:MAG: FkbM family methyltransferase [Acutalibacteraceae bacterium]
MEQDLWRYLQAVKKPIVLYGMGNGADKIIKVLTDYGVKISGVFATDGFVREKCFHGFKLTTYSDLKERFGEMTVLLCFGSSRPEVLANIKRISAEQELYAPDVPVYGDRLFNSEYLSANKAAFDRIYSRLADDKSRETFENVIRYKLSGRLDYLFGCEVSEDEPYSSFLRLDDNESYIDLGAYTGDTIEDFISRTSGYNSITAVEPDKKSFKKLVANTEGLKNFRAINACVSDASGTAFFSMRGGRNSSLGEGEEIAAVSVDEIAEKGATFIKADVEGGEEKAIEGARNTLLQYKPKIQLACYHRTEDLIALPNAVDKIRGDYRLYMRRFPSVPAWDMNYYFI